MCAAIGKILKRCPKAYYAPMGLVKNEDQLREYFKPFGVNDRVIFLGNILNPSQIARSMELYLNEFPFGSGIGILDAMAAGCPVVSMFNAEGPQQGRYGGTYFGLDKVVHTGKIEDYVELACKLVNDKALHTEWSKHAKEQYEKRSDEKKYVKSFEEILLM
jgi:glycosyltransferase involved in cell wall biosynthesis